MSIKNSRPRLRSSIESNGKGGIMVPHAPSFSTAPNIGGNAYSQDAGQTNTFTLASDAASVVTSGITINSGSVTEVFNDVVPFPNIPVSQGTPIPSGSVPLLQGQANNVAPTGTTTLLFRVFGASCSVYPLGQLVVAAFSVTPYVQSTDGLIRTSNYLPPGGNYRTFSAKVIVAIHNPGTVAVNDVYAAFTIHGDLYAGYPSG